MRFQYNFKYLIWFFSNFYKVEIFKINLLFLNKTFWSCDIATSCNILATKFFLHKEPSVCLDSLPLIVIILLMIIQLITYQQLSEIKPLEISSSQVSPIEAEVLALGLIFVPTPPASTHHLIQKSATRLIQTMKNNSISGTAVV